MGEGARAALVACVFLESRLWQTQGPKNRQFAVGYMMWFARQSWLSRDSLLETNCTFLENPSFITDWVSKESVLSGEVSTPVQPQLKVFFDFRLCPSGPVLLSGMQGSLVLMEAPGAENLSHFLQWLHGWGWGEPGEKCPRKGGCPVQAVVELELEPSPMITSFWEMSP